MLYDRVASHREFTPAAREAALARRRELAARPKAPVDALNLFVTRGGPHGNRFGWEIRRFGAIVVARGEGFYTSTERARQAGERALRTMTESR